MKKFMLLALNEAEKASEIDEIPVGAVIVRGDKVISFRHNDRHTSGNVLGHAEILAIMDAQKVLSDWRLYGCDMYVTLKPCNMCMEVIKESRLRNIYYLVENTDQKANFAQTKFEFLSDFSDKKRQNYSEKLSCFFQRKR